MAERGTRAGVKREALTMLKRRHDCKFSVSFELVSLGLRRANDVR